MTLPGSDDEASARGAVDGYVRVQCEVVTAADGLLREAVDEVHDTRVAIRRLRSTLRVFAPLFVPTAAAELNEELTWYSALLGAVRDREVLRLRLEESVAALPPTLVMGPVAEHIDQHLLAEQNFHHEELTRAMDGDRYRSLLTSLTSWAESPPYAIEVGDPDVLVRWAKQAARKAKRRLAEADQAPDLATALHRARKAAKRARYSAELVEPLGAENAIAHIRYFKRVQTLLGTYQDSVIAADLLRHLGAATGTLPGHNGFTYGVLYELEIQAGEAARDEVDDL